MPRYTPTKPQNKSGYIVSTPPSAVTSSELQKNFKKASQPEPRNKEADWYIFVQSFLDIAALGCDKIIDGYFTSQRRVLVISILFNLKHSIEIIIKALTRTLNKDTDSGDGIHDTKKLFSDFKKQKKLTSKSPSNKAVLVGHLNSLEKIVEKYSELSFLKDRYNGALWVNDKENIFFKYPENKAMLGVDYGKFCSNMNKADFESIKEDIAALGKITTKIKSLLN